MINEEELIAKFEKIVEESKEEVGLTEPARLRRVAEGIRYIVAMGIHEEIKARIEREEWEEKHEPIGISETSG